MAKRTIQQVAEGHVGEAMECLVDVIRDEKAHAGARVAAANAIINRAYGMPLQSVAATVEDVTNVREISDDMLVAIVHMRAVPAPKTQRNGDGAKLIGSNTNGSVSKNGAH